MRTFILTVFYFLLFSTNHLLAQSFSFKSDFPSSEVIPVEGQGFLLVSSEVSNIDSVVVVYFDDKAQPQSTVTIPLKRELGELGLEHIFVWNGKMVVLKSLFYSGRQRNRLLMYEYSLPDLELVNSEQLTEAYNPFDLRLPFHYDLSPDSSKLLIMSWSFFASDSLAQMELKIYDAQWQELEKRQHKLSYKNEKVSIYGCKIDDESNCYILGDVYTGKNIDYIKPQDITNFVTASFKGESEIKNYAIETPGIVIDNWLFELDKQQNLVAIALFKEGLKVVIQGSMFFRIDRNTRSMNNLMQRVDKESFIAAFPSEELGFRTPKDRFVAYYLKSVIFKENAYYIIAENLYSSVIDEIRDILIMSIDLEGNLKWLKRLPKSQKVEYGANLYASFASIEQEESLLFFYNGNAENFEEGHGDRLKSTTAKNAVLCVAKIDLNTQKITRQQLGSLFPKGYIATSEFSKKITKDKVVAIANGIYNSGKPLNKFNVQILMVGK